MLCLRKVNRLDHVLIVEAGIRNKEQFILIQNRSN
jgi:hypothetical protein